MAEDSWTPEWQSQLPVDGPIHSIQLTRLGDSKALLVHAGDSVRFLHPQTGASLASLNVNAVSISRWHTGTDTETWAACGPDGLNLLQTGPETIVTMTQLQAEPCSQIETARAGIETVLAIHRADAITLFSISDDGAWAQQNRFEFPENAVPLLNSSGHSIAISWTQSSKIIELSQRGLMEIPTGGPIQALGHGPSGWVWTVDGIDALYSVSDKALPIPHPVLAMSTADLDGDSRTDLVLQHEQHPPTVLWGTKTMQALAVKQSIRFPAIGDTDVDGCPELFSAGDDAVTVYYGRCSQAVIGADTLRLNATQTREPTHLFKLGHDVTFNAYVGQPLRIQLAHSNPSVDRFAARGGPLWLKVTPNGILEYTPTEHDVGMWELTVLSWEPLGRVERFPFVFKVHRSQEKAETAPQKTLRRRSRTYSNVRLLNNRVALGFGGSLGFSEARNSWAFLGTDWVVSASPHISIQLDNPEDSGVWWSIAGETAPWFQYLTENMQMRHYLSSLSTVGWNFGDTFQMGAFGQAGFFITAVGLRARWFPIHDKKSNIRHGAEFRVSWLPSNAGLAGYGALFYVIRLPKGL